MENRGGEEKRKGKKAKGKKKQRGKYKTKVHGWIDHPYFCRGNTAYELLKVGLV